MTATKTRQMIKLHTSNKTQVSLSAIILRWGHLVAKKKLRAPIGLALWTVFDVVICYIVGAMR